MFLLQTVKKIGSQTKRTARRSTSHISALVMSCERDTTEHSDHPSFLGNGHAPPLNAQQRWMEGAPAGMETRNVYAALAGHGNGNRRQPNAPLVVAKNAELIQCARKAAEIYNMLLWKAENGKGVTMDRDAVFDIQNALEITKGSLKNVEQEY